MDDRAKIISKQNNNVIKDKSTLLAVLRFLKDNNLKDTEKLFLREANLKDSELFETEHKSDSVNLLAVYKSGSDPCFYNHHYTNLKLFINASLDAHKCELSIILYPVFVQMYIQMVANAHELLARQFFDKFRSDQESYYAGDLRILAAISKPEHIAQNQIIENFKSSKFTLRMSRDSYNHLKRHLVDKKQSVLLNIIQEHLFIDVYDGIPRTMDQIRDASGGLLGEVKRDSNKLKVYYGLLKEPDLQVTALDEEEIEEAGETLVDEATAGKKKKKKKDMMLTKKMKNDPNSPSVNKIPLPEMKDMHKQDKIRSLRESVKRAPLSCDKLPNTICYSLVNAHGGVTAIDITDDSTMIAVGFSDSHMRVYSLNNVKLRRMKQREEIEIIDPLSSDVSEKILDDRTATESKILRGHSAQITAICFSHDKSQLLSASIDTTIRLWSTETWTNLVCYRGHMFPVWDVKFSPHGYYFASAGHDYSARLWATDHNNILRLFVGHMSDIESVEFHPNSNYLATGSADRTIRIWDNSNGLVVRVLTSHKDAVNCLKFSNCGKYLVSAGADKKLVIWDISTGDAICHLRGHHSNIYSLAFSRDGMLLCSGGGDCSVRLWDFNKILEREGSANSTENSSVYQVGCFGTKKTPIQLVHFTRRNMLVVSGAFNSTDNL